MNEADEPIAIEKRANAHQRINGKGVTLEQFMRFAFAAGVPDHAEISIDVRHDTVISASWSL